MSRLTDNAEKRFRSLARKPDTPEWYPAVGVVVGVAFFFFMAWQFISPGGSAPEAATPTNPMDVPATIAPSPTDVTAPTATTVADAETPPTTVEVTTEPTAPSVEPAETVMLADWSGGSTGVDRGALDAARAATVALFTGDFSAVALAEGVTAPALPRTWPTPQVDTPTLRSMGDGVLEISFAVDPDGAGPETIRRIDTAVTRTPDGAWAWLGV